MTLLFTHTSGHHQSDLKCPRKHTWPPAWVSLQLLPYAAPAHAHSNCLGNPVGLRQLRAISSSQIPVCVLPCRCLRCSETSWRLWRWCLVGCCRRPGCLRLHLPPWANTEYNNFNFIPCAHIVLKGRDRHQHDDGRLMSALTLFMSLWADHSYFTFCTHWCGPKMLFDWF